MSDGQLPDDEPCYVISVAARLVSLHPQTLRYYDRIGLIRPTRTAGRFRLYSQRNIETLRKIARLTEDLGVNLAGVEVILNMSRRIEELQSQLATLQKETETELDALRQDIRQLEANRDRIGEQDRVIDSSATEVESNLEEGMS